jgi:hypothetical protein
MHSLCAQGDRPAFYLDETWISQNHSKKYIWHDSHGNGGLKIPTGWGNCVTTHMQVQPKLDSYRMQNLYLDEVDRHQTMTMTQK